MLRFLKRADFDFSVCMKSQAMWFLRQSFAVILSSTLAFPLWATNYDANGNTTASNGMGYAVVNHRDSGARLNHMILEVVHGVTTKYLVDTQNPTGYAQVVQESMSGSTSANRELSRAFVYGLERISQLRSYLANGQSQTQTSYYVYDGHGSVRALADPNGNVTDTYDYDAFGNLIHSTGTTPNTTLFAGEQYDPDLNLYYNRARYLNVSTGRFWSMDTEEGDPQSPLSLHKYLYSSNDPTNRRDPSGHFDIGEAMTAVYVAVTNFVASVPYLLPALAYTFAAVNVTLFVTNEDYRVTLAANPDLARAAYEDVALLFNFGGEVANAVFVAARGGAQSREIVLDLFGGASSQIPGAVNIDLRATAGIRADVSSLPIASESVDTIVASGPRAPFLDEASRVLKPGGRIYINAVPVNPFAQVNEAELGSLRLRLVQEFGPLDPQFSGQTFLRSNDSVIDTNTVRTTILEKY
jgi:RHS repeat-associated protein